MCGRDVREVEKSRGGRRKQRTERKEAERESGREKERERERKENGGGIRTKEERIRRADTRTTGSAGCILSDLRRCVRAARAFATRGAHPRRANMPLASTVAHLLE